MQHTQRYQSPLGGLLLAGDETGLTGVWFEGGRYFAKGLSEVHTEGSTPAIDRARQWLDIYFAGNEPDFMPPLSMKGTPFRMAVWAQLLKIPYGSVITYGELARTIAGQNGPVSMSAQAIGGAVGHNPISIIVPCHRVIGADGSLTGYAGGMERKQKLLELEKAVLPMHKIEQAQKYR